MPYIPERRPEITEAPPEGISREKQKAPAGIHKYLRPALLCFFALLAVYGAVRLIVYGKEFSGSRQTGQELKQIYDGTGAVSEEQPAVPEQTHTPVVTISPAPTAASTPKPTPVITEGKLPEAVPYPDNPDLKVPERFKRLRKKSGYIIGWLSLDGVDEAVALKDNSYFLNHDATGKKSSNGAIFLDESVNLLSRPYTIWLYGHNMKSGNMFGKLKKFLDRNYLFRHRIVHFDSLYEEGTYAVFAAAEISTVPGTARYYDLWSLDTRDREAREKAIEGLVRLAAFDALLDVRAEEQILVLVTCIDQDTDRLVVAARRLREGETEEHLTLRVR